MTLVIFSLAIAIGLAQLPSSLPATGSGGGLSDALGEFVNNGLSPEAMNDDFDAKDFLNSAESAMDMASIGQHVNKLIGFIKPGMFKDGVDVSQLMDMASSAKSIADASGLLKKLDSSLLASAFQDGWGKKRPAWQSALDLLG